MRSPMGSVLRHAQLRHSGGTGSEGAGPGGRPGPRSRPGGAVHQMHPARRRPCAGAVRRGSAGLLRCDICCRSPIGSLLMALMLRGGEGRDVISGAPGFPGPRLPGLRWDGCRARPAAASAGFPVRPRRFPPPGRAPSRRRAPSAPAGAGGVNRSLRAAVPGAPAPTTGQVDAHHTVRLPPPGRRPRRTVGGGTAPPGRGCRRGARVRADRLRRAVGASVRRAPGEGRVPRPCAVRLRVRPRMRAAAAGRSGHPETRSGQGFPRF
jgi:hypothetical protein